MSLSIWSKIKQIGRAYPVLRGMLSYGLMWPTCSVVEEYLLHGTPIAEADYKKAARFSFFGSCVMAPAYYNWMKHTAHLFKDTSLITSLKRSLFEQALYTPYATIFFYFAMSALEGHSYAGCVAEVKEKAWPTYLNGLYYWTCMTTLNFSFVPERNRMVFISICSFFWTVYLAHMKSMHGKADEID